MKKKSLIQKINSLGGVERLPPKVFEKGAQKVYDNRVEKFIGKLPSSYRILCEEIGNFRFKNMVTVKCIEKNPVAGADNEVSADYFYDCINDPNSVSLLLIEYEDQFPDYLLPIFDGEPGDFICINMRDKFGSINYWHHESPPGKNVYLIANNFDEFIMKLEKEAEDNNKESSAEITKVTMTSKFLEMLKKDGYGPKE